MNNDGEVNVADVTMLIGVILGDNADSDTRARCDVNCDNETNVADVTYLINMILAG